MRIRKRFPASSALITDPQLNRSRVVQQTTSLQLHPTHHHHHVQQAIHDDGCQPFDLSHDHCPTVVSTKSSKTALISDNQLINIKPKEGGKGRYTCDDDDDEQDQEDDGSTNYISPRKQYTVLGVATTHTGVVPTSSSSRHANATSLHTVANGRWYDGDEVIPLKKRRGSFLGLVEKMQPKMMSKTNKKCTTISMNDDDQGSYHAKESVEMYNRGSTKKMNKKGSGIMEGSRCSRVNGRGWRCCQQTLVGYSLCEHHLGKGRLRSIASVKNRAMGKSINTSTITTTAINTSTIAPQPKFERLSSLSNSSSSSVLVQASQDKEMLLNDSSEDDDDDNDNDDDYEDGEKKKKKNKNMPVVVRKKRMKLGMVKARSLSSLLSQTSNTAVSVASEFNNSN